MVPVACGGTADARQQVQQQESRAAVQLFNLRADNPERVRIEGKMEESDVKENRGDESPNLTVIDQRVDLCAERQEAILRAAGETHHEKDDDIESKDAVGDDGASRPERLEKLEILLLDLAQSFLRPFKRGPELLSNLARRRLCGLQSIGLE